MGVEMTDIGIDRALSFVASATVLAFADSMRRRGLDARFSAGTE